LEPTGIRALDGCSLRELQLWRIGAYGNYRLGGLEQAYGNYRLGGLEPMGIRALDNWNLQKLKPTEIGALKDWSLQELLELWRIGALEDWSLQELLELWRIGASDNSVSQPIQSHLLFGVLPTPV